MIAFGKIYKFVWGYNYTYTRQGCQNGYPGIKIIVQMSESSVWMKASGPLYPADMDLPANDKNLFVRMRTFCLQGRKSFVCKDANLSSTWWIYGVGNLSSQFLIFYTRML
jgi:hypothetical protein